jgi:low affinity Fe/Cu permease
MRKGVTQVSMEGYIDDLLKEYNVTKGTTSPAKLELFDVGESEALPEAERELFHTAVAKLLYLSMRVKPEMLVAVIFLCTRVNCATAEDAEKLRYLLRYVYHTREEVIELDGADVSQVRGMIDAAFAQHEDGRSHSGLAVMVGRACVMVKSSKQKIMTKDSTEAELVGLTDMLKHVMKCHEFMVGQGLQMKVPELHQDNTSTIIIATKGSKVWRNKYMKVREAMVKEMVNDGDVAVRHTRTEDMVADVLTKAMRGWLFKKFSRLIRGISREPTGCVEPERECKEARRLELDRLPERSTTTWPRGQKGSSG